MKVTMLGLWRLAWRAADRTGLGAVRPGQSEEPAAPGLGAGRAGDTSILIDTSPDLREQLLSAGVNRVTGIVWTHHHADHMNGIDDLRALNRAMNKPIDVYGNKQTLDHVRQSFGYVLEGVPPSQSFYKPCLIPHEINGPFQVGNLCVIPFEQDHGFMRSMGFRIGDFAYSTDVKRLDEAAFEVLQGVDVWIVDCLRDEPHPTHSHYSQTLDWIRRVKPRRAVLTHMNHSVDYATWQARLPAGVEPGYDGLVIALEAPWVDSDPGEYYGRYMRDEA